MNQNKIFSFLSKLNLIDSDNWNEFYNSISIDFLRTKNKKINISICLKNLIDPSIFFGFLEKTKTIDDSIIFNFSFDFDIDKINEIKLFDYLIYYVSNNLFEEKTLILSILKRKRGKIENNSFFIFYLNQNEKFILSKQISCFEKFFQSNGLSQLKIDLLIDEKEKEVQLHKKNIHENILNLAQKENKSNENQIKIKSSKNIVGSVVKIHDLFLEMQTATIEGEIFNIDKVVTKNGFTIYKFYITDFTDSIVIKIMPKKNLTLESISSLKNGMWVKAKINLQNDMFENNDLTGLVIDLTTIEKPKKYIREDSLSVPRVELINHTNMTAFEGLVNVGELFEIVKKFNHKVLSITDKNNCQNFPEVYNLSKKYPDIKIIYGIQFDKFKKNIELVTNPIDTILSKATYVLFDLETTGLSPYYDKIIEFGAIKYSNGIIIDRMQFFVNPNEKISEKIFSITKISNKDVENGIQLDEALKKIKEFFGDSILIAHNGIKFDMPFINCKLEQLGMEIIKNPLIDTMQISRSINEQISGHSLGAICRKFKIDYDENQAHRADKDSEYLLDVWRKFLNILEQKEINNLLDVNTKLQNKLLLSRNRGSIINLHCKNQNSIKKLYELISISLTRNYSGGPKIFYEDIEPVKDFFLISNSPTEGDVIEFALSNTNEELDNLIKNNYDFIMVSPPDCFKHEISRDVYKREWLENAVLRIINIAKKYNKLVVASSDTYYIDKNDSSIFNVYVHTKSIGGKRHRFYKYNDVNNIMPELYYRNTTEMMEEFSFLKDHKLINEIVVTNSRNISEMVENGIKPIKENLHSPHIEGASDLLKKLIYQRAYEIFGENINDFVKERIDREINSVINNGYAMVYWFSHLLVKKSIEDGFMVGSRGSVGSSVTAWLVNITEVNALPPHYLCSNCKYFRFVDDCQSGFDLPNIKCPKCSSILSGDGQNIPFETFMGFEGDKIPDIDLNFSAIYQSKAHDFIRDMFGKERVFRAGTISTVAKKTAYGYVKSYLEETGKFNTRQAEIIRIASKCENVKRTTGQHPGGIIVIPHEFDVFDFTPYNYPADDVEQDWFTTHFAFESLHDSLLKFDILGHDNPTVLKMLSELTGVDPTKIPNYDEDVMMLFNSTKSLKIKQDDINEILKVGSSGIPEFGTNFVKEMLLITRPKNFSDLIRISGLSHGTNVWNDNAKNLIQESGLEISDVISCRDDIMVFLLEKGIPSKISFKIMEDVRKGKGLTKEYKDILKQNNIPEWYINSCEKIAYLFPKAHASAYVIMAWKIAWFKIHYPLHFYASYFSIRTDVFDIKTIIEGKESIISKIDNIKSRLNDPKQKGSVKTKEVDLIPIYEISLELIGRGFEIKNIDLNKSDAKNFVIEDNYLIPPFSTIDGLGEAVANSIIEARNQRPFTSKDDIKNRTKITNTHFKILDELRIISHLEEDDQLTLFN